MPYDFITQRGQFKGAKPDAGGAVLQNVPILGIVKDNSDAGRTGKLRVLIISQNTNVDPNDERSWRTVYFSTPFFGLTEGSNKPTGLGSYTESPSSYGMWMPAPDIGTLVICIFIEGRADFGFCIASVPKPEAMSMLPAIGAADNVVLTETEASAYGGAKRLPTVNINPKNPNSNNVNYYSQPRPVHSYQAAILHQQGLTRDELRGTIGSNAQRESPSRVFGISTPGRPVYEGGYTDDNIAQAAQTPNASTKIIARRGGHTFVMDDGDLKGKDNLVRLRSANGHTILMSDDGQTLFIIHSNGHSWVELGKEGTVDVYATNSINLRTMGDLNLHADNDVNINAGNKVNIAGLEMSLQSETTMTQRSGTDFSIQSGANYGVKVDGVMSLNAAGDAGLKGAQVFIEGKPINLNTGSASFVPAPVKALPITQHPDAIWSSDKGWLSTPFKLPSITSRAPSHQPWPLGGLGVGVDVKMTEDSALPPAPKPAASAGNSAAASAPNPPTPAPGATATVPSANPTAAAQAATNAAQPASPTTTGVAKITPQQAEASGYITKGSAPVVQKLLSEGKPIPNNLMTGKDGMDTWDKFTKSPAAQASAVSGSVADAARALAKTGVMTGKEDPKTVAGITLAGAAAGVNTVTNFLKQAQSVSGVPAGLSANLNSGIAALGTVQGALGGFNKVAGLVKGGNLSAASANGLGSLMTKITGGLGKVASSVVGGLTKTWDTVKGTVSGIFSGVKGAVPNLKPNEPQNIREIAKKAEEEAQKATGSSGQSGLLGTLTGGIKSVVGGIGSGITTVVDKVGSGVRSAVSTVSGFFTSNATNQSSTASSALPKDVKEVASAASAAASSAQNSVSSGLSGVPGGVGAAANLPNIPNPLTAITKGIGSLVDKAKSGVGSLLGLAKTGAPANVQNQIESTLAAVNTSDQQVKVPEAAEKTNDATEAVRGAVSQLVGKQVPLPPSGTPIEGYNPALVAPEAPAPDRVALAQEEAAKAPTVDKQISDIQRTLEEQKQYDARLQARVENGTASPDDLRRIKENAESAQYFNNRLTQLRGEASLASRAATSVAQEKRGE